ncbi:hypothetical protein G7046_g798 [Stylonectria norvegica]|nr:hypothetical protein G7046_g798 [Stylonectria norvegica]
MRHTRHGGDGRGTPPDKDLEKSDATARQNPQIHACSIRSAVDFHPTIFKRRLQELLINSAGWPTSSCSLLSISLFLALGHDGKMPRLRGTKYLTCFYCGKRSNTRYDGVTREFLCLYCDATNYLDESGDITDPPVATEREAPATHYALQQPPAPNSAQHSIFCSTCLKNQRLFTASLAQYLPDDTSHPDYPELERNYYRYRKSLEERYPQVCDECASRVEEQIIQAGYTAKTDHLRRMMERTRGKRIDPRKTSVVDWVNALGRGLWWGGLLMQMLWHLKNISAVLEHGDEGMYDPDDTSWQKLASSSLAWIVALLPPADTLMKGAISSSILSAWWNPQFVQVSRGFTRHLLGFTQWYSFQGLIIFFRFLFRRVLEMDGGKGQSRNAQLTAHLVMATVMNLIYTLARRSIRIDTTPLFGPSAPTSPKPTKLPRKKEEDTKTFSDLLNEALDSPTPTRQKDAFPRPLVNSLPPPYPPPNPLRTSGAQLQLNSLSISSSNLQDTQEVQYSEEMDWAPTQSQQSQHRAFADPLASNGPTRPFGAAPVDHEGSPFWYKVPPAPVNPAQRLRNPIMPVLRSKPAPRENPFFRGTQSKQQEASGEETSQVSFKQPKFFAPERERDEADSLADILGQSFSLGQDRDQSAQGPGRSSLRTKSSARTGLDRDSPSPMAVEAIILALILILWLLTSYVAIPFGREMQLAFLSAAGTIALRVMGDMSSDIKDGQAPSRAKYVEALLSVAELVAVCVLGWGVWKGDSNAETAGIVVLGGMLAHHMASGNTG